MHARVATNIASMTLRLRSTQKHVHMFSMPLRMTLNCSCGLMDKAPPS